ncbi:MAG: hypothetical protein NT169_08405 [Chloroflexi bacterium]|nr:hypothetical protein [Chloroflexota bacterium]
MAMSLNPFAAECPINVLNLPDYAREQLGRAGIRTVDELIATLPRGPHLIGRHTWKHIQRYLEAYLAKQPDVTQGASHTEMVRAFPPPAKPKSPANELASYPATFEDLPSAKLVSDRSETVSQQESLPEALEDHPVTELAVHTYALDCLQMAGIETIGELWAILTQGYSSFPVPGIGRHLWNEIQETTGRYVASHGVGSISETADTTAEDGAMLRAVSLALPATIRNHPIDKLEISVRSYNCLKRAGVDTIGQLLTVLPQGCSTIRNAGRKTWSEIEDAVADYLSRHEARLGDHQAEVEPPSPTALAHCSHISNNVETLELPTDITDALRSRDIKTLRALAILPLFQLARISELSTLTREDWFSLMPAIKDRVAPERTRPAAKDARPKPSLLALNLSARLLNCLLRAGILDLDTLAHRTLAELVKLRNFGAKSIEELLAKMRDALASGAITFDDATLHTPQPEVQPHLTAEAFGDALNAPTMSPTPKLGEVYVPEVLNLDERLNAWFADLNERQRSVIQWRYGLTDGQHLTLEEIGERLDLTRERVRQLQGRAFRCLQHPPRPRQVRSLILQLYHAIVGAGGIVSEAELGSVLTDFAEAGEFDPQGAVRLLLDMDARFSRVKGMQAWCLTELRTLIPLVDYAVVNILAVALAPILLYELLQRLKQTGLFTRHYHDLIWR